MQLGYKSYFIVGEQTDWAVAVDDVADMVQTVYEFQSASLRKLSTPITPNRLHRNASPVKNAPGMISAGGDLVFHSHVEQMLVWWKHLLGTDPDSVDFTSQIVRTDAAYTAGVAFSLTTQPTATTPVSAPGQLVFTFTNSSGAGTIAIAGTDQNDNPISETIPTGSNPTTVRSTKYFKTVNTNGITVATVTADSLQINADKNTYTHTLTISDALLDGLTFEVVKGEIPNTYTSGMISQATLTLAETIGLTATLLARNGALRQNVAGGATPSDYATAWGVDGKMTDTVYANWGAALQLDGVQLPVNALSLAFNNNLAFPTRYNASRFNQKPVRTADREIALTASIDYETVANGVADFDLKYLADTQVAAIVTLLAQPEAGPEYLTTITMPRCELTAFPDPELGTPADLVQQLSLRPIRTAGATGSDELEIEVVSTESGI